MKTKDFIKMLQEADPSGEAHINLAGGPPRWAHLLPGYYDGYYDYIDEDGNWVTSRENEKLNIWTWDIQDFVENLVSDGLGLEEIKEKFKFKMVTQDTIDHILEKVEESYNDEISYMEELNKKINRKNEN